MAPTREQIASFEERGYLVVEELISSEWLREIQEETADLHEQMAENPPEGVHVSWEHEVDPTIQRRIKQLMHAEVVSPALNRLVRSHEVPDVPLWSAWSLLPLSSLSRAETSGGVSGPPRPGLAADASGGACRVRRARRGPGPPPAR